MPTVTDADCVLGYLPDRGLRRRPHDSRRRRGARPPSRRDVAQPLGIDVVEAAWGIERIVNANMANAMRRVLSSYGADPRELAIIAYGGNGPLHAWALATELGADRVLVPKTAPAFSALGLLVADYVVDLVRSYVVPHQPGRPRSAAHADGRARRRGGQGARAGRPRSERRSSPSCTCRWRYGGPELRHERAGPGGPALDANGLLDLTQRFHDLHESDRGFAFRNQQPQVRGVRLTARADTVKPNHLAELGRGHRRRRGPQADAARCTGVPSTSPRRCTTASVLGPGATVVGPALIEEPFTVVAVAPGWTCTLGDARARYELTRSTTVAPMTSAFFDEHELAVLAAAVDRLIPADDERRARRRPRRRRRLHRHACSARSRSIRRASTPGGPFSGRWGGDASFEQWLPLGAMEELAWRTRIEGSQGRPEREFNGPSSGCSSATATASPRSATTSRRSTPTSRIDALDARPAFKRLVYEHACEGIYGDPVYGGNRDYAGWDCDRMDRRRPAAWLHRRRGRRPREDGDPRAR